MTTKMSSDPAENYFQPFKNQQEGDLTWKKEEPIALRKLVLPMATGKLVQTISAILSVILCSRRLSFLRMKESGSLLTPTVHTEEICLYKSPRWLQRWYVITIKMNENKTDHDNYWIHLIHKGSSKRGILCGSQEFLVLLSSNSRTLWWYSDSARTDGIHIYSS